MYHIYNIYDKYLFESLHLETSFERLFNISSGLRYLTISDFSPKFNMHFSVMFKLGVILFTIHNYNTGSLLYFSCIFLLFLESVMLFSRSVSLNDVL